MKRLMLLASVVLLLGAVPSGPVPVTLEWSYTDTDVTFYVYHSPDIGVPLSNWPVLTNAPGTARSVTITMDAGRHYFFMTSSNLWGESNPSNVASLPSLPKSGTLSVRKGN